MATIQAEDKEVRYRIQYTADIVVFPLLLILQDGCIASDASVL